MRGIHALAKAGVLIDSHVRIRLGALADRLRSLAPRVSATFVAGAIDKCRALQPCTSGPNRTLDLPEIVRARQILQKTCRVAVSGRICCAMCLCVAHQATSWARASRSAMSLQRWVIKEASQCRSEAARQRSISCRPERVGRSSSSGGTDLRSCLLACQHACSPLAHTLAA